MKILEVFFKFQKNCEISFLRQHDENKVHEEKLLFLLVGSILILCEQMTSTRHNSEQDSPTTILFQITQA